MITVTYDYRVIKSRTIYDLLLDESADLNP